MAICSWLALCQDLRRDSCSHQPSWADAGAGPSSRGDESLPIPFSCPACGSSYELSDDFLGQDVECTCGHVSVVSGANGRNASRPEPSRRPKPSKSARGGKSGAQLLARVTCPHCWHRFPPYETLWVAGHPDLNDDPKVAEGQRRFLPSRFDVKGRAIDSKGVACTDLACPECHLTVPRDLLELPPVFVSILGAPSSGKSYFLATAIWQLRRTLSARFRVSFEDADPGANRILHEYEETLFHSNKPDQLVALPKTELDGDLYQAVHMQDRVVLYPRPFVFRLRLMPGHPRIDAEAKLARTLCLYDNAGEHFLPDTDSSSRPGTRHLAVSKALLFLFDPTQHPSIREACRDSSEDPQMLGAVNFRQDRILTEAARRVRAELALGQRDRDTRPLIVAVTKFDAWMSLVGNHRLSMEWVVRQTAGDMCGLHVDQMRAISDQVRGVLNEYVPEIVGAAEAFSENVIYVPVSALGHPPEEAGDALGIRPADIDPIWIELPLLYALHRVIPGLIPSAKKKKRSRQRVAANE